MTDTPLAAVLREHRPVGWNRSTTGAAICCGCNFRSSHLATASGAWAEFVDHIVPLLSAAQVEAAHAALARQFTGSASGSFPADLTMRSYLAAAYPVTDVAMRTRNRSAT